MTVIAGAATGQTLAMVPHRNTAALSAFLMQQGHRWRNGVKVAVSDGSMAYKSAIDAHLGHAARAGPLPRHQMVLSRAHTDPPRRPAPRTPRHHARVRPAGVPGTVRAAETRRPARRSRPGPPRRAVRRALRLRAGRHALQELHGLCLADDRDGALEALGRFCDLYETGELPEFHDVVDTIIARYDEILARCHSGRASNGRIEGINNLLQVLRRTAHGY